MNKGNQSFFLLTHWVRRIENVAIATKSYSPDLKIGASITKPLCGNFENPTALFRINTKEIDFLRDD